MILYKNMIEYNKKFWTNKNYVEDFLKDCNLKFSIKTLGRGHRGVELFILEKNLNIEKFLKEYSGKESKYAHFAITPSRFTGGSPFYVSIVKFGYNYNCKYPFKSKLNV
jgi:hypothetical protein